MGTYISLTISKKNVKEFKVAWKKMRKSLRKHSLLKYSLQTMEIEDCGNIILKTNDSCQFQKLYGSGVLQLFSDFKATGDICIYDDYGSTRKQTFLVAYKEGFYRTKSLRFLDFTCSACMEKLGRNFVVHNNNAYCNKKCAVAGEL